MFEFITNNIFAVSGIVLTIITYFIYISSILKGKTKPHLYTWLIWFILDAIGFFAQISGGGGIGAAILGFNTVCLFIIILLSIKFGEKNITKSDKISLIAALTAIIPWMMLSDPLISVIMITAINFMGFFPTFRKSWNKPYNEPLMAFLMGSIPLIFSLFSLDKLNLITALYPSTIIISNILFIIFALWRRSIIKQN